jgi:predicted nucleic acid-binding protein
MTRVFWDTMLFVYFLERHGELAPAVESLLARSLTRKDVLLTSYLALAEVLVGLKADGPSPQAAIQVIEELGFKFLEFDRGAVEPFRRLRRQNLLKAPDAMNLACAASADVDLFLTGDRALTRKRLHIPGIHFIVDFENPPF